MNVLIMAAGALGGYIGGEISKHHNVMLIARNQHLQKIQKNGLIIKSITSGDFICKSEAHIRPPKNYVADLVIYCVKSYHNNKAIPVIKNSIIDNTTILTLQNGIGSGEFLASHFGKDKVVLGAAYIDASISGYGVIQEYGGNCKIVFGKKNGRDNYHTEKIKNILTPTKIKQELSEEILTTIWEKLIFISGLSGMTCITNSTFDEIISYNQTKNTTKLLITETYDVAIASGIKLEKNIVETTMEYFINLKSKMTSSMHQDLINGNPLEIDVINGFISKIGKIYNVPTPINDTISSCLSLTSNLRISNKEIK